MSDEEESRRYEENERREIRRHRARSAGLVAAFIVASAILTYFAVEFGKPYLPTEFVLWIPEAEAQQQEDQQRHAYSGGSPQEQSQQPTRGGNEDSGPWASGSARILGSPPGQDTEWHSGNNPWHYSGIDENECGRVGTYLVC